LISSSVGTFFVFALSTTTIFAADQENGHSHQHQCKHKMSSADLNKDGKISKDEFIKHHEAMFDKKDTNKDGFLDETEMHSHRMKDHAHTHSHDQQKNDSPTYNDVKK
jgi:hypothetical protein